MNFKRFVRTEFKYLATEINQDEEKESLNPWSTQWGLAFNSPMPLSVYEILWKRNETRTNGLFE